MNEPSELTIAASLGPLSGCRVLVIDDDEPARHVLRLVLESEGATVATAGSSREALAEIDRERPDVMLVDLSMPAVNGFEFVEQVRQRPASSGGTIPAAALTGYISSHDRAHAELVGFQDYLVKPVEPADLIHTIKRLAAKPTT